MIKTPVRGMRDILPQDLMLRAYLLNLIEVAAGAAGYQKIETPAIEHLENLTSKIGGENEALIFKILKRGRTLETALAEGGELADSALRYDLTVPLARYYAAHSAALPAPFKALQIGPVWRADAPQKGRFRQFTQCDMDILGDASLLAEIDVITTVLSILRQIAEAAGLSGLTLHLNDRRLLTGAAAAAGFAEEDYAAVLIALDKHDKIGLTGVREELVGMGFAAGVVDKFLSLFKEELTVDEFATQLGEFAPDEAVMANLSIIINDIQADNAKLIFDPTLVRGMGYYTGPIFECTADGLASSIAGGGRYDQMIGKFSGQTVPACGFSIGFERLLTILADRGFRPPAADAACAILVSNKVPAARYAEIFALAAEKRRDGRIVSVFPMMRNLAHQIAVLEGEGYGEFEKVYE